MADDAVERRGRDRPPLIVFVHIPKTAGTTLRAVLSANEPAPRSRPLGNVFKGGGGLSPALIERLRDGRGPDLRAVRLVRGHFPLGIRDYLPKQRELRPFSFVREPAERTLSHYFAIRDVGGGYALAPLAADATLDDALAGGYIHDNLQTRMLSGLPEPFGDVDDEMLERAKHNLRHELVFVGLTERFDESLVLAKQRLGLRSILYRSSGRVNTARPRGTDVPEEVRRAAERCNHYDIELYRYAQQLFDTAVERQGLEFQIEVAALRAARADGEIALEAPSPPGFSGEQEAWRMLLQARASLLRVEFELAASRVQVATARSRARGLMRRVENLESQPSTVEELDRRETPKAVRAKARRRRGEGGKRGRGSDAG
jgi:hypothetical protein